MIWQKNLIPPPPPSARPWVYYFAVDGNITSNGITADLEAMKRGGVLYFDVDQGAPKGPVKFASPQWFGFFKHLCSEADRLGLKVSMNNDAGFTGSGGPWITPELSMQKLVWSETFLQGPARAETVLPHPETVSNFYREVAVLAFPTPAGENHSMAEASPTITSSTGESADKILVLTDGDPKTSINVAGPEFKSPQWVQLEFPQKYLARSLTLNFVYVLHAEYYNVFGEVQVSDDGLNFRTVCSFHGGLPDLIVPLNDVKSRWFRIVFTRFAPPSWALDAELPLAEISLVPVHRIAARRCMRGWLRFRALLILRYLTRSLHTEAKLLISPQ